MLNLMSQVEMVRTKMTLFIQVGKIHIKININVELLKKISYNYDILIRWVYYLN